MGAKLSEEKRKYYKDRLAHYLRSYRERHGLSQQDAAQKIDYALDHYKRLETAVEERIANTIEFLANFASLDFGNVVDFLVYLENTSTPGDGRDLYPWEQSLLKGFNELPLEARRDFTSTYCGDTPNGPWTLAEGVELLRTMSRLDDTERKLVEVMISRLQKIPLKEDEKVFSASK
jgi:hypothetical protein